MPEHPQDIRFTGTIKKISISRWNKELTERKRKHCFAYSFYIDINELRDSNILMLRYRFI